MCTSIRFSRYEFRDSELDSYGLSPSGDQVRVSIYAAKPVLPIFYRGKNIFVEWGNKRDMRLPRTGFCRMDSLKAGKWRWFEPEKVKVVASFAMVNGVWFQVREGISAILVSGFGKKKCFILTEPSTRYFKIMTGSLRMPVMINQIV
ncbi:hypothetical protein GF354_00820 [Candidatus Peregrinibacteria bacterium]|nr:hypothetical protein [Candidatus Peregrinibacteria bacterium]